jgi:cytoskeletal protein CcmA (bactofilin family)
VSLFGKTEKDALGRPRSAPRGEESRSPLAGGNQTTHRGTGDAAPRARGGGELANIGKSITIKGDLTGNEDLVIDGDIEGRIDLPNNQLTIGPEGKIKADIHAKSAVVVGHVTGNVSATERIEVQASGIVDGDVRAPRLVVQEGAVLNGAVEMGEAKRQAPPAEPLKKAAGGGDSQP